MVVMRERERERERIAKFAQRLYDEKKIKHQEDSPEEEEGNCTRYIPKLKHFNVFK